MEIRKAKAKDWEKLRELLKKLVKESPPVALELEPLIMKEKNWIEDFPKGNLGFFTIAIKNNKIVGFCYLAIPKFYKPIAYIGIAIEKDFRKNNIGAEMFYHVAGWASAENLTYIIADVWEWNTNSIKFFKALGFEEKSKFQDKYKGELKNKVRMVKTL